MSSQIDFEPELSVADPDMDDEFLTLEDGEDTPPEAFYHALRQALRVLDSDPYTHSN